ncbi:amino acid adenylation domain-containing protein [Methylocaldum sp.]|uniref:non-ribosomal peptide synthetase n=1 Tax=Methylocaldum sp. TaxID=1969727 RepID=UPI0032207DA0
MNADNPLAARARLSPAKRALLERQLRGVSSTAKQACAIPRLSATDAPLSDSQSRLWVLWTLEPDSALYNLGFLLRIRGGLDMAAVQDSLERIVGRHEVLRTRFVAEGGEPRQVIGTAGRLDISRVDLTDSPEVRRAAGLHELARELAQRPFDLSAGPLLRVHLVRLEPTDHALVLVLHHSIADAWSLGILVREFAALYPALRDGYAVSLPELPVQYADYAVWQRNRLQGDRLETHLAYWRERLAGAPPTLELPTDRPRPAIPTGKGATYCLDLPQSLSEALQRLGRGNDSTLFMILAASFGVFLNRHTGQTDLCIGYPVANRPLAELEDVIGFFVNTLVLRTDLSGNPRFSELLGRVRETVLGAQAHQELPFEKLVEALQPVRQAGRNPLFQVMLVLQNAFSGSLQLPDLDVEAQELDLSVAKFDLTLSISERERRLHCVFEYSTELFREDTVARWAEQWQILLEGIVADPQARLSELPLLTKAEQRQLAAWNATDTVPVADSRLHGRFETQAAETPEAVAIVHGEQTLSYGALNQCVNRLAHALRQRGAAPEVRVGVCLEPGLDLVTTLLAILKAGAAYVPIDPAYPAERRLDILADSGASLVVTRAGHADALSSSSAELFCLDRQTFGDQPDHAPEADCHPDHPAYLIYTSGSTGRPKGVVVSHRNAVHSTAARFAYYEESVHSFLLLSSYAFDSSVAGIFWTLGQGGRLCLPSEADRRDPSALARLIVRERVSHLLCLPSLYGLLLEQSETGQLASLTTVIVAGEACPAQIAADHYRRLPSVRLYNEYGPTEASVWSSVHAVQPADAEAGKPVPIGRPIDNTRIHLLDVHFNPVPVGVPGELYIGGPGIARGYHGRPQLTAERFLPDPFSPIAGTRLYRTGDRARYRADGALEFLGRIDHQVKIRGYRIELGEIEARLLAHSKVREAVVLVREDRPADKRLVAYLVLRDGTDATGEADLVIESVRASLKAGLPEYMVPAAYVVLKILPQTPNGKVDREALPAPEFGHAFTARYVPPRTADEELLARIWAEVLRMERVGIHDNFFELGGDSIRAIQVVGRIREAGSNLNPRLLFQCQTIAELAPELGRTAEIKVEQGAIAGEMPLTPIQHWFFEQHLVNHNHWNQSVLLEMRAPLSPVAVDKAAKHLLAHHDALRLRFRRENDVWHQTGLPQEDHAVFERVDLSGVPAADRKARMEDESNCRQGSLNLEEGPLIRVVWFDLGEGQNPRLLLTIHHLVVDGVSWRILIEDLYIACRQLMEGRTVALPAKTTSFKEWAERLRDHARSEALARELDYWLHAPREYVDPAPPDMPTGDNSEEATEILAFSLDEENTRLLLRGIPSAERIDIGDILLGALAYALTSGSETRQVLINLEGHGREDRFEGVDLSRTVGWFTSLFPVLLSLPAGTSLAECLDSVKRQLRRIPHKGLPYGIGRYLGSGEISRRLAAYPEPRVTFNYFGQLDATLREEAAFVLAPESGGRDFDPRGKRPGELSINARILDQRLHVEWSYSRHRYYRSTIANLAQQYLDCLREATRWCAAKPVLAENAMAPGIPESGLSDLRAEAVLDETICPRFARQAEADCNAVLLTGVTGFVGAFLLEEIQKQTPAAVYCLVRASNTDEAGKKLFSHLDRYGLADSIDRARVVPICGDLAEPRFGLSERDFADLAGRIDAIYHNGALTNLIQPYFALKQANVSGTREILRLACSVRQKPVYYTSTLSVFGEAESPPGRGFDEDDVPEPGSALTMGYAQSKWVAEQLIRTAGARGCPVMIFRLGAVTGHSRTGAWSTDDFHCRLLKTCIELGKLPRMIERIDMTPVDYAARSIVYLSRRAESLGKTFHLVNPNPLPVTDFVRLVDRLGYPMKLLDYGEWKREMFKVVLGSPAHVLYPFLPYFENGKPEEDVKFKHIEQRFDCEKTLSCLSGSGISCCRIDADLLSTYFSYLLSTQFLSAE